jgi:hypothetical protein
MHEAGEDLQRGNAMYTGSNVLPYTVTPEHHLRTFASQYWGALRGRGGVCVCVCVWLAPT